MATILAHSWVTVALVPLSQACLTLKVLMERLGVLLPPLMLAGHLTPILVALDGTSAQEAPVLLALVPRPPQTEATTST